MVPLPRRRRTQQSTNMMRDKSMSLKLENIIVLLFISYVMARVCVCLLRRLQKVAVTHLCTFDRRFRMAEPGRTVMRVRYRRRRKPCWGCFLGIIFRSVIFGTSIFLMSTSKTIETTITTSVRYPIFNLEDSVRDPQTLVPLES
jgi:hypothetical protein